MTLTEPVGCSGFKEDIDRHLNVIRSVKPLHSLVYFCFSLFPSFVCIISRFPAQYNNKPVTMLLQCGYNFWQFITICNLRVFRSCFLPSKVPCYGIWVKGFALARAGCVSRPCPAMQDALAAVTKSAQGGAHINVTAKGQARQRSSRQHKTLTLSARRRSRSLISESAPLCR